MHSEDWLPSYTQGERSRELSMRSRLLRWRAQRTLDRSKELLRYSTELQVIFAHVLFLYMDTEDVSNREGMLYPPRVIALWGGSELPLTTP